MRSNERPVWSCNAAIALLALSSPLAMAQEPAAELQEVVVTAQKREQNLQDVGIAVNAYDARAIRELGLSNTEDIAAVTPNMSVRNTSAGMMPIITIRGIGAGTNDAIFATTPPSAATHVDEVYYGSPALLMFSQFDLERVEVLKGPQGTLFGRNTTAGSINYITAKPRDTFGANLELSGGFYAGAGSYYDARAHVTGPISESLSGRFALMARKGDSYVRDLDNAPYAGADMVAARALLQWRATESLGVQLNVHGGKDQSSPLIGHLFLLNDAPGHTCAFEQNDHPVQDLVNCTTARPVVSPIVSADGTRAVPFAETRFQFTDDPYKNGNSGAPDRNDIHNAGASVRLDWHAGAFDVVSLTAYDDAHVERDDLLSSRDTGTKQTYFERYTDLIDQFSQELRLSGATSRTNWLAGLYYFEETVAGNRLGHLGTEQELPENYRTILDSKLNTQSWAAFTDLQYQLTRRWALVGGLRYTFEEKQYQRHVTYNFLRNANYDVVDPSFVPTRRNPITGQFPVRYLRQEVCPCSKHWDDVNWKAGLNFRASDSVLAYGLVSTGFKGGQFSGSSIINPPFLAHPADPETITAYELGIKSDLLDRTLRVNVAAFYYDYKGLQIISTLGTPQGLTSILDNAKKTEVKGLDVDLIWLPIAGLTLSAAVGYIDGTYTDFVSFDPFTSTATDFSGLKVINAPDSSVTAGGRYQWSLGSTTWSVGGEAVYTSAVDFSFQDEIRTFGDFNARAYRRQPVTVLNARVGFRTANGVDVSFWGKNLTNEAVLTNIKQGIGEAISEWAPPRTLGITLNVDF